MKRTVIATLALAALFTLTAVAQKAGTPEAQLGAIINQAEVEGRYETAISSYKKFLSENGKNRRLAARAQYHLGVAYEKLGNPEARKAYEQVVRDYPNEPVASDAKQRLTVMVASPSGLLSQRLICFWSEECNFSAATISADGRFMAFRDHDGVSLRNMETGKVTVLAKFNGEAKTGAADKGSVIPAGFAFSPDGRQTAYGWNVDIVDRVAHVQLRVIPNEANAKPRILVDNREFTRIVPAGWTNDGKILVSLAKQDRTWELAWVSVADGAVKTIKSLGWRFSGPAGGPSLSPDGRSIAYSALPTNPSSVFAALLGGQRSPGDPTDHHIYVLAADGSGAEIEVVKDGNLNLFPTWMPDGKNLVFISNRTGISGIWSVPAQGGSAARVPVQVDQNVVGTRVFGMTRSGSYYYQKNGSALPTVEIWNLDGSGAKAAGNPSDKRIVGGNGAAWSPDGKRIATTKKLTGPGTGNGPVLSVYSVDTASEKLYFAPRGEQVAPTFAYPLWSHDGNTILLTTQDDADGVSLSRLDLKSGEFKKILPRFSQVGVLSPDDKTFYFVAHGEAALSASSMNRLMAADLNSGQQKQVTAVPGVSPSSASQSSMVLSPDGQTLYLKTSCTDRPQACPSIVAVDVATGKQKEILTVQDPENFPAATLPGKLALSPDGRTIAAVIKQAQGFKLIRIGVDGRGQRTVYSSTSTLFLPAWTRDGAAIVVSKAQQVLRIPADGGIPQVVRMTDDESSNFSLSPDGLRIATSETGSTPDELWAIDNFASFLKTSR